MTKPLNKRTEYIKIVFRRHFTQSKLGRVPEMGKTAISHLKSSQVIANSKNFQVKSSQVKT